jgi:tetratricopeptide (TPR) repeat protein
MKDLGPRTSDLGQRGALLFALVLVACGGSSGQRTVAGGSVKAKENRDPIKPGARQQFDGAMRVLRLGGPEADESARSRLKEALKEDPSIWEAWFNLGAIAWREGDDDEAIDDYGKALALQPKRSSILLGRAEAERRSGKKKEARGDYETAIKGMEDDDPGRRDASTRMASLLRDNGDFDDAVETLRDTVRVSGVSAKIYTELGQIYIAQKRLELAQLVLGKAAELDAKDPAIFNAKAILALKQGRAQEAFELFDQAVALDATYFDARFNKASVLLDAGDYARAKPELTAIVDKRPDDYAAVVALGVAHRGLKEFADAKSLWNRVIKDAPKRSNVRADAMWNVALLELDFTSEDAAGKADLERYLQEAPTGHAKRPDADNKCKEVKCH